MSTTGAGLLELMPVLYRLRDEEIAGRLPRQLTPAEQSELLALEEKAGNANEAETLRREELRAKLARGPLAAFLELIAREVAVLHDGVDQLYDDLFVETAAPWALSYIGDLIGYRLLHPAAPRATPFDRRAEIGHTVAFRRRKGTASMLEQLARDVTGFPGAAVAELFTRLATTQCMNHVRTDNQVAPALRDGAATDRVGTAFDAFPRTLDVRAVESGAARPNVPNIACFLWRLDALRLSETPAVRLGAADTRFRFHPLGIDCQLVQRPEREEIISHLAEPVNVPGAITRRYLQDNLARLYGTRPADSFAVWRNGNLVPPDDIVAVNLADSGTGWMRSAPLGKVAVDPELGRLAVSTQLLPATVKVTFHRAGVNDAFGGEYPRAPFDTPEGQIKRVPTPYTTIQGALNSLGGAGVVEITDSGRYTGHPILHAAPGKTLQLRAAEGCRPVLDLTDVLTAEGGDGSKIELNGLLIANHPVMVPPWSRLARLVVRHCTLVPGAQLRPDGTPYSPGALGIDARSYGTELLVEHTIAGAIRGVTRTRITLSDSIIDATDIDQPTDPQHEAIGAGGKAIGALTIESSTVLGLTRAHELAVSDSILLGRAEITNRQTGCARFSYLPPQSLAPRRYHCAPAAPDDIPHFASLRFASPLYARLATSTPKAIRGGAEDESDMGAHHRLQEPQRAADLVTRLDEYLRLGLRAGLIYET
jgi:hypothetical protein